MGIGRATVPKVLVSVCLESFSESIYRRMKSLKIKFPKNMFHAAVNDFVNRLIKGNPQSMIGILTFGIKWPSELHCL